ncbi:MULTISPECIES: aminotransferase class IV [unclassified Corynebacterium]|uniref:aminotransferase class IV n=1 Tax=unclassified Corynebacterium TaxID=2624378 RepID=UPI0029C9E790|nr:MULTISPECIES: aminotransferase class IV [unclassified Corynebacterium]WPF65784.1 aminotransferase class IV [Corynebacterium sp. 22KM0430]WPF68278.1 aminotransferase class IV [Corynebacterium sp. 21KM1197]
MTVVMDSWLVRDGQVAGLNLHLERFAASCQALLGTAPPESFLREVREACARARGEWFPKVEAVNGQWGLSMRPAPPRRATTVLWIPEHADERAHPEHKGPDMAGLLDLRSRARARGADDAVLHRDGAVVEAATATLLFARGKTLIRPPGPRLPSVTERLWVRNWPGPVRTEAVTLAEAQDPGLRCWALSSLHGATEVVDWLSAAGD